MFYFEQKHSQKKRIPLELQHVFYTFINVILKTFFLKINIMRQIDEIIVTDYGVYLTRPKWAEFCVPN